MDYILEPEKKLNVINKYDVVIIGGGIAGVSSALAAARQGMKVCIVEKENFLGGLATLGLVAIYLPLCDGMGNQVVSGIGEELLKLSIKNGPGEIPECWLSDGNLEDRKKIRYKLRFNPATFALNLDELMLKENIEIFFDTRLCSVSLKNDSIDALIIENKSGRSAVRCKTVIDCSGDADVIALAGETTKAISTNKRTGWFYSYDEKEIKLNILNDPLNGEIPKGSKTYDGINHEDVTDLNIDGRKMIISKLDELKKINPKIYPIIIPSIPQFRMTRRLANGFEPSEKDEGKYFEDSIGMIGDWRKSGPVYHIPYRTLYSKKINNLIAAGRCISVGDDLWDVTRSIPACAVTGEAAGIAAAVMIKNSIESFKSVDIRQLQSELLKNQVIIQKGEKIWENKN